MKKILTISIICFLLLSMTTVTTLSKPSTTLLRLGKDLTSQTSEDMPSWAQGNFTGKWGIREHSLLFGMVEMEFGEINGHYRNLFGSIYVLKGVFYPHWNNSETTNITGIYFLEHFIFGQLGDIDINEPGYELKTNQTGYSGYGDYNQTCFDWRIVSKTGPTFYIKGTFS